MDYPATEQPEHDLTMRAQQQYKKYSQIAQTDPDYPALHLAAAVGRLNDPNGLVYRDGTYHAFYQYSPLHPTKAVFWRHATSTDLTHWVDRQTAIAPTQWYDKDGCYSGSGLLAPNGDLEFYYTGNVKNQEGKRAAYQCLFTSSDGGKSFNRYPHNPLITSQPAGYTAHFRDPQIFTRDGKWWAVFGAQRDDLTGAVLIYSSPDRRNWDFAGELSFDAENMRTLGYMFECPALLRMQDQSSKEEKDVLIFSPQGMEPEGEKYNNIFQTGYVVGKLDGLKFRVETPFTELDSGTEFYAPQAFSGITTESGEPIVMGWLGNAEQDDQPSLVNHWVHSLTYPRALSLRGAKIYQNPVPQLQSALSPQKTSLEGATVHGIDNARVFRLTGTLSMAQGPVHIRVQDEKGPALVIKVGENYASLDRSGTRYHAGGDLRTRTLEPASTHSFDLFIDASCTEFFVDGGAQVFSSRTFFHGKKRCVEVLYADQRPATEAVLELYLATLPTT